MRQKEYVKLCTKIYQYSKSRKPPSFDDGFPLWMWGVKEKDMAVAFATI